jgi:hypothetical protein
VFDDHGNYPRRGILIEDIPAPLALIALGAARGCRPVFRTASGAIAAGIDLPLREPLVVVKYLLYFHDALYSTMFTAAIQEKRKKKFS